MRRDASAQAARIIDTCGRIADLLGIPCPVSPDDIALDDRFLAPGYGVLNSAARQAIRDAARTEALVLDPVYSGKAMAGALALAGEMSADENVIFLHTGGTPALFAYGSDVLSD